jgi:predicted kinase
VAAKLILTRGLPGSGKSTWARSWVADDPEQRRRINRDDVRFLLSGKFYGLSRDQEDEVTRIQQHLVRTYLASQKDVVVDDTNLNARFAKDWLKLAQNAGAEVEWNDDFLKVPLPVCIERDEHREQKVGADVIKSFYTRYFRGPGIGPKRPELAAEAVATAARYDGTPGSLKAFLVDLDGTIASNGPDRDNPNRGYFDWHRVGEDLPIDRIIDIIRIFEDAGLTPIYVSGRDGSCFDQTYKWIATHVYGWTQPVYSRDNDIILYMRPEGDMRKDSIVKLEIFDNEIRNNYDVQFCIDDRDQVVAAYRSIGLTVLQVADGDF